MKTKAFSWSLGGRLLFAAIIIFELAALAVFLVGLPFMFFVKLGWLGGLIATAAWYFFIWVVRKYYPWS